MYTRESSYYTIRRGAAVAAAATRIALGIYTYRGTRTTACIYQGGSSLLRSSVPLEPLVWSSRGFIKTQPAVNLYT